MVLYISHVEELVYSWVLALFSRVVTIISIIIGLHWRS